MDPKQQLSQLDPKLKAAYERVMASGNTTPGPTTQPTKSTSPTIGGPTPAPLAAGPTMPPSPPNEALKPVDTSSSPFPNPTAGGTTAPSQPPSGPTMPTVNPTTPMPQMATQSPTMQPQVSQVTPPTTGPVKVQFNTQIGPAKQGQTTGMGLQKKKGGKVSPVLIIVAGVVFLLAYAIFWMKVFNIPIPFLG